MNRKNGFRRTYTYPLELIKSIEAEAVKRLKQSDEQINEIQCRSVCRNIICMAVKKQLPEIVKLSKEEFEQLCLGF